MPPQECASWDQHGVIGYYVGASYEHYRCYRIWIPVTKAFRISDCLDWFPADILSARMEEKLAALPLLPPPTELQRLEMERKQRVAAKPVAPSFTAPLPPHADITAAHPV